MNKDDPLNYTKCNLCGSDNTKLLIDLHYSEDPKVREFRIVQCEQCDLIYLNPRPSKDKMKEFYPQSYLPYTKKSIEEENSELLKWIRRHKYEKISKTIEFYFKHAAGSLLDVGCSTGLFLNHMAQKGWSVTGIEPNHESANYAIDHFNINVLNTTIASASLPKASFDIITYWDVMEHVYDPMAVLFKTNDMLKKNGLLLINFPPAESYSRRIFQDCWIGYDPPRHLFVFSRETMKKYLTKSGFEILSWRNLFSPFFAYAISLKKYLSVHDKKHTEILEKIINLPGIRFFFEPFFYYKFLTGNADLLTVIARKK